MVELSPRVTSPQPDVLDAAEAAVECEQGSGLVF